MRSEVTHTRNHVKYRLIADVDGTHNADGGAVMLRWCHKLRELKNIIFLIILLAAIVLVGLYLFGSTTSHVPDHVTLSQSPKTGVTQYQQYVHDAKENFRAKHTTRVLPQCIIIGARKAGTRALLTFLNLHNQVMVASNEIHFFDNDENYAEGLEWYRRKMPYAFQDQITIEKTPAYFVDADVPERVYKMDSHIKLILIVRDPVARTMSDYLQIYSHKMEKNKEWLPFEELVINEAGEVNTKYNAIRRSIYYKHLMKWLEFFKRDQILVINGEKLVTDPVAEVAKVENFLNIEHQITDKNFYYNKTRGFYCIRNETMEKCLNPSKGRPHPEIEPDIRTKLYDFFRPWNKKFYEIVGEDFGWPTS